MSDMNWFPKRWPPTHPDWIQLYSLATPNGQKIGIALEEMELDYDAHLINIGDNDQFDEDYLRISPNGKIPTLIDPNGPDGKQILLMESGAILWYLAEKTGKFLPQGVAEKYDVMQWLLFQVGHIGPMFGQFGHFYKYAKGKTADSYAVERYTNEAKRLLTVLDKRLANSAYVAGSSLTIADFATMPWVSGLSFYDDAEAFLNVASYQHVTRWKDGMMARPAIQKGIKVCGF